MSTVNKSLFSITGENYAVFKSIIKALGDITKDTLLVVICTKTEMFLYGTDVTKTINFIGTFKQPFFAEYNVTEPAYIVLNVSQLANLITHSVDKTTKFTLWILSGASRVQCVFTGENYRISMFEIAQHMTEEPLGQLMSTISSRQTVQLATGIILRKQKAAMEMLFEDLRIASEAHPDNMMFILAADPTTGLVTLTSEARDSSRIHSYTELRMHKDSVLQTITGTKQQGLYDYRPIKQLKDLNAHPAKITIYFQDGYPLKLDYYFLVEGECIFTFILAPTIKQEES